MYDNLPSSNLPNETVTHTSSTTQQVIQYFDQYYLTPINIDAQQLDQVKGFFESKGFDKVASINASMQILMTAKAGKYTITDVLENLKGYNQVQLNDFLMSVLNFNRNKSSILGKITPVSTNLTIKRNIVA
jgi:hypothetical protein